MLPPVLEIYVVWHPEDAVGKQIGQEILEHFHGTTFTGLIGGAVEVFMRSEGWTWDEDAPRPIPVPCDAPPNDLAQAQFTAIVPILGNELASAAEDPGTVWHSYVERIVADQAATPKRVGIFPYRLDARAMDRTVLSRFFGHFQSIAATAPQLPHDTDAELRCRDLSQGLAQFVSGDLRKQLTVFISHTKRGAAQAEDVEALISLVRDVIHSTRLGEFFDASDLQPGTDWAQVLEENAGNSALLAIRTDLYPTRQWCQKEMLIAKRAGMPIVILDAICVAEERGSFLMDHVPRAPARREDNQWRRRDVYRALNLLVDECLKRELWRQQLALARDRRDLGVSWWAPHAPEPITLIDWLVSARERGHLPQEPNSVRIIHPDPPLGPAEREVLEQMLSFGGMPERLDVMTPRQLAGRGG